MRTREERRKTPGGKLLVFVERSLAQHQNKTIMIGKYDLQLTPTKRLHHGFNVAIITTTGVAFLNQIVTLDKKETEGSTEEETCREMNWR